MKKKNVDRILIVMTGFHLESPSDISCEEFSMQFDGIFCDSLFLNREEKIQFIQNEIWNSKIAENQYNGLDTRAKMYLYRNSGATDTLCFGIGRYFSYNGQIRQLASDSLIIWLQK